MGRLLFSVIVHIQWFCQALLFWGDFWTKQKKATYTLSSPTQRQTLAQTLFRFIMLYGSFHSNVANEKGETLCLWPPLLLQMESQNPKSSHHQPSSYVQIMVRSFPFVKTKWITDLQHYWGLTYLNYFPDLRNWLYSVYFISVVATKEEGELQLISFTYKACNILIRFTSYFPVLGNQFLNVAILTNLTK